MRKPSVFTASKKELSPEQHEELLRVLNARFEKTEGVKKILSELAKQLIATFPELRIGETNRDNYLK